MIKVVEKVILVQILVVLFLYPLLALCSQRIPHKEGNAGKLLANGLPAARQCQLDKEHRGVQTWRRNSDAGRPDSDDQTPIANTAARRTGVLRLPTEIEHLIF
jgi:hypothetical protein